MKHNITLSIVTLFALLYSSFVFGQTFLNGSFENTTATCNNNLTNSIFNNMMSNCFAFGNNSQIDIYNDTCIYGSAQEGNYFIALTADSIHSLNDAFSLKLSEPIISGNQYLLTFYNRQSNIGLAAGLLEIGYSTDSLSFGTVIDTISIPTTTWGIVSRIFTPTINCKFITVCTIYKNYGGSLGYDWTFIDNFTITQTNGINTNTIGQALQIFPNPFSNQITLELSTNEQLTVILYEFSSRKLLQQSFTNTTTINTEQLIKGMYLYEVRNKNGIIKNGKIIKE